MPLIHTRQLVAQTKFSELEALNRRISNGQLGQSDAEIAGNLINELSRDYVSKALDRFVTQDQAMCDIKSRLRFLVGISDKDPVIFTGPTGTGKEVLARVLEVPGEPFIAINCGGILNKELAPSLFFGHTKGSFTGAIEDRKGCLVKAGDGVVFLDEIGDLSPEMQAMLLRAIQELQVFPVGSVEPVEISCRFIAATKYHLEERVEKGLFREDLFARLSTFEIHLTGLRERPLDIPLIAAADPLNHIEAFPDTVLERIYKYNVRGIQAAVKRFKKWGTYE